jgi:AraC-like DNA-binding protein
MKAMYLKYFTTDSNFPFFIQYGHHEDQMILHSHADFSELVIVLEGSATHIIANEKYTVQKGDVFVINNDTIHGYENAHNFRICNIMYQLNETFSMSYDIWQLEGFHALFVIEPYLAKDHLFQNRLRLSLSQYNEIEPLTLKMLKEYEDKLNGWKTFLHINFISLALFLSRAYQIPTSIESGRLLQIIKPISYIEKHFMEPITIDLLAKQANLSPRQLTRIFQETYGTSPGNYLLEFRIQKSKNLLNYSDLSICDIAYQSGFNDSNYYSRQFRNLIGITPTQFRKTLKTL